MRHPIITSANFAGVNDITMVKERERGTNIIYLRGIISNPLYHLEFIKIMVLIPTTLPLIVIIIMINVDFDNLMINVDFNNLFDNLKDTKKANRSIQRAHHKIKAVFIEKSTQQKSR